MKINTPSITCRLINFLIDIFAFTFIVTIVIIILKRFNQNFQQYNVANNRMIAFTVYFGYYFFLEVFSSISIGKLVTKTKVVDKITLSRPSAIKIFLRTLFRFIPFEFLSIFFTKDHLLWHDILSRTTVIKKP